MMSWAARSFISNGKFLRFTVSGHHHNGYVYISVNGLDMFDVHITTFKNEIVHQMKNLYDSSLRDAIDEKVEKIPAYKH